MSLFILRNPEVKANLLREIGGLSADGKHEVEIRDHKTTRSIQQNKRYWAIIKIVADFMGQDKEETHDMFRIRFLGPRFFQVDGVQYAGAKSTATLSTKEFCDYCDMVEATATNMGLVLPTLKYYGMED